jgi:peptide chain release factor 2
MSDFEKDCEIRSYPIIPAGAQHVNTVRPGIQVTHLPSGIIATSVSERSQLKNKKIAMAMIEAGLNIIRYNDSH